MHFYNLSVIKSFLPSLWQRKCKCEKNQSLCSLYAYYSYLNINILTFECTKHLSIKDFVEIIIVLYYDIVYGK